MSAPKPWKNSGRLCSIEGCEKPAKSRGWCRMHCARWERHGDPLTKLPGGRGVWTAEQKAKLSAIQKARVPKGPDHHAWSGDDLTYRGAHTRVRLVRGLPDEHRCACGRQARQWAFSHAPRDLSRVRYGEVRDKRRTWLAPYSSDVQDYVPVCVSCHTKMHPRGSRVAA